VKNFWYGLYVAGAVAATYVWWHASGQLTTPTTFSRELAVGNITGLLGTYTLLWQLVLLSRLPVLENVFGLERLTWLHKWNGYLTLTLLTLHGVFLTLGYAIADHAGLVNQFVSFLTQWQDVLQATVGFALLVFIVFISIGIVRRGFKYETWYYVHIFIYLAILLAFSHQLSVGSDLIGQPLSRFFWYSLYVLAAGLILIYRFIAPAWLFYHHRFAVAKVVRETPATVSVYITGRHLEKFHYLPGQFVIWRFFTKGRWWQAHPFSLSVAPNGQYLRLTAKAVGDFTRGLPNLRPGTLVSVDGPHGNFTLRRTHGRKLLLIAGGSGITPIRAMLEALPPPADVAVLYAARKNSDIALRTELNTLAARPHTTLHYLTSDETAPGATHGTLNAANLRALVPDAVAREVMLCGPPAMMDAVTAELRHLGVARRDIHTERFAY
jgi:predicted ferric reductase